MGQSLDDRHGLLQPKGASLPKFGGDNDLAGAAEHYKRALAFDPSDLKVLGDSAGLLRSPDRMDEALALEDAIVRRDPVNVTVLYNLGYYQRMAGRLDAAIASYRTVLSLAPGRGSAHAQIGTALLLKGDAPGALAEIEQETSEAWKMIGLPMAYHALGLKAELDAALIPKYEKDVPFYIRLRSRRTRRLSGSTRRCSTPIRV